MNRTFPFGAVAGRPVHRIRLRDARLTVELVSIGAALHRVIVDGRDVLLGHPRAEDYATSKYYLGVLVGRYANRISQARFTVDGVRHSLLANEGGHTLHGGPDGFSRRIWELLRVDDTAAEFGLTSPDGDQGFPGELAVRARYSLGDGALRLDLSATTTAPTPVNLTSHGYWNPAGEGSGSCDDVEVEVPSARVVELDDDLIPTGRLVPAGSRDLRRPRRLADVGPLDTCFVVDDADGSLVRHATLSAPDLSIAVFSDQPGVQLFTGDAMSGVPGLSGTYGSRAGVAVECQNLPDAPNRPGFPESVLRPGSTYRATTVWQFHSRA